MKYNKNDIINVATKLGRLVNGGVVGYYAGGKTSEVMRNTIPDELVNVVERHKKVQLGASLAQSFIPGAGVVATSAAVASLWKMYYDINQVLGIKISDNVGKSLTSAVLTNLSSAGAQIGATAVSEGAKFIPFVGWIASAAISTVTSTAIVYGAAYLYLTALTKMYEVEGKFDLNYLTSSLEEEDFSSEYDDVAKIKQIIADVLGIGYDKVVPNASLEDLGADDLDVAEISMKLESEFGISLDDEIDEESSVNDIIEHITGESISDEEDEEYEDEELENDRDEEDAQSRFNSFFDSYIKGEYNGWKMTKLAKMFEYEGENCPSDVIKSEYYCVAAVIRMDFFIKEWFNQFKNYPKDEDKDELEQQCIQTGFDDIQICRKLLPDDKEYLLISGSLAMLRDFFMDDWGDMSPKDVKDEYIDMYGDLVDGCKDFENSLFPMEWLTERFKSAYNTIISYYDNQLLSKTTSSSYSDAEQEYLDNLKEFLEDDAEITPRERKMLDRIRQNLGISEERAKELEASLAQPQLTEDEQEYIDMYREYAEKGKITEKERRRLDKFASALGISDERMKEIEKLI